MAKCSADAARLMGRRRNSNECFSALQKKKIVVVVWEQYSEEIFYKQSNCQQIKRKCSSKLFTMCKDLLAVSVLIKQLLFNSWSHNKIPI